jgi:FtsP/CotA-like multicopper oxidase with cupredoxin domain
MDYGKYRQCVSSMDLAGILRINHMDVISYLELSLKNCKYYCIPLILLVSGLTSNTWAEVASYDIDIKYEKVNYTGKEVYAMTVGGTIPGTVIEANEGDILRVTFHNKMDVDTSIHWHGILLPNDQDGVPYLTTMPIRAGKSFTYEFPLIQSGTYWYHSHTGLQEQRGVYGALVFHPKVKAYEYDREHVVVFSDWTDENPDSVLRHLKMEDDYYALKKDTVQSWLKVIKQGAVWKRLKQEWSRMGPMDLSDVGYDAFLVNGQKETHIGQGHKGEKILLRIVNASASTYFDVQFAGGMMKVVSADGVDVESVEVDRIRMAVAETYDVIVTLPEDTAYELRATAMDGTGYASGYLGDGEKVFAADIPKPNPITMEHHAMHTMTHEPKEQTSHDMQSHQGHHPMRHEPAVLNYNHLRAKEKTEFSLEYPIREITLRLTGNMRRYIWSFDDKILEESDMIRIKKGEVVRFKLVNETMMNHPIHLHGHFFRVINKQEEYSPLKHTVDVAPLDTTVIEFFANQEKDWFFHCHILYHMMAGMARVIHYEGTQRDLKLIEAAKQDNYHHSAHWYAWGNVSAQSNMVDGFFRLADVRNQFELEWDNNYSGEYDVEPKYLRNISMYFDIFVGGEFTRNDGKNENLFTWGFRYLLPLLVEMEGRMSHEGTIKLGFGKEFQLTDRLELCGIYEIDFENEDEWDYNEINIEHEYRVELEYRLTKDLSFIANYDSDYRAGGGVRVRF